MVAVEQPEISWPHNPTPSDCSVIDHETTGLWPSVDRMLESGLRGCGRAATKSGPDDPHGLRPEPEPRTPLHPNCVSTRLGGRRLEQATSVR